MTMTHPLPSSDHERPDEGPSIAACLWFDGNGREAAEFYTSLLPDSEITNVRQMPDGVELLIEFTLGGRPFRALNGGPQFRFNEAVSFVVPCDGQAEADRLWHALVADGGEASMCGWLKDRFGVSWQVVPSGLDDVLFDPDPQRAQRAQSAMFQMRRLDVAAIRAAADGVPAGDA